MSAFRTTKSIPTTALIAIFLMFVSGMAQAGDKGGYLGIIPQDISSGMAKALDLENKDGVLINHVVEGSPAEEAGLQDGDVIIKFNGEDLENHSDLTEAIESIDIGDKVDVVVIRSGKTLPLEVELGERRGHNMVFFSDDDSDQIKIVIDGLKGMHGERGFMGVELDDISEQMGSYFEVEDGKGALITSVTEDSAAEDAGLEAGDVIIKIGDEDIESAGDVYAALEGTEPDQKLDIKVSRKGKNKTMDITLGEVPGNELFDHLGVMGGKNKFFIQSPKMLHQEMRDSHRIHKDMRIIYDDESELKEMRDELEKMKKDLKKMKKELKEK